jgi:hypothetical protein
MRRVAGVLLSTSALGALWLLWGGAPASAGAPPPILVTTDEDVIDAGDGELSLREAVAQAAADGIDAPIQLAAETTYELEGCGPDGGAWPHRDNTVGDLDHAAAATLRIVGAGTTTIEQTCASTAIIAAQGDLVLEDLALTGGGATSSGESSAIVAADLRLDGVRLYGNGMVADQLAVVADATGSLELVDSAVEDNGQPGTNGLVVVVAAGDDLTVTGSTVRRNRSAFATLSSEGDTMLATSTVAENTTGSSPVLSFCDLAITDSQLADNVVDVYEDSGAGGAASARGYVRAIGSTFDGNRTLGWGGALLGETVLLEDSEVLDNEAALDGGGVMAAIDADRPAECGAAPPGSPPANHARLVRTTVAGNTAGEDGGGVHGVTAVELDRSTVSGNQAGGIGGGVAASFEVVVESSTVTSNHAQRGGGIAVDDPMAQPGTVQVELRHATVAANKAATADDLVAADVTARASALGSPAVLGGDCAVGVVGSLGGNVSTDPGCFLRGPTDRLVGSLGLGDLADNGGSTLTRLPDATSPLVDSLLPTCATTASVDQRGVPRPVGNGCDVGAVESPWVRFRDVAPSHPFFDAITALASDGIIAGYDDGTFRPGSTVSRQAAMAFLYRLSGSPEVALPSPPTFSDVGTSHPFRTEVEWAASAGITQGYGDGTLRPSAGVSRQALVAWLFDLVAPTFEAPNQRTFRDVSSSHPFFLEVEWAASEDLVSGYQDGTFRPGQTITRQATAAILDRGRPLR